MDDGDFGTGMLGAPRTAAGGPAPSMPTGFSQFRVAPRLLGSLTMASAAVVTMRGEIDVSWQRSARVVTLNVTLPPGAVTAVTVPLVCSPAAAVVRESGVTVWDNGVFTPRAAAGIWTAHSADLPKGFGDGVVFTAGSGSYSFNAICPPA